MSHISGIGGAFVFSNDPDSLAQWYSDHLGLKFEGDPASGTYYQMFFGLDPGDTSRKLDTTFAIMKANIPLDRSIPKSGEPDNMYGDQPYMINLRVYDLDRLLADLAAKDIHPIKRQDESYGKFAWIRDADGNRVELYEPILPPSES
jgi:catechol 2,3-dioxygenase-like lactoylglutathione lyase family enzyme